MAKDGRVVWVHGSASIVNDANGKPSFLQGIAFDITTIKHAEAASREAEEALRRINVELDRRVQERTEEPTLPGRLAGQDRRIEAIRLSGRP